MITVEGADYPWRPDLSLRQMLTDLKIIAPVGLIYVNGRRIIRKDFESYIVPDGSIIKLMSIAGG